MLEAKQQREVSRCVAISSVQRHLDDSSVTVQSLGLQSRLSKGM